MMGNTMPDATSDIDAMVARESRQCLSALTKGLRERGYLVALVDRGKALLYRLPGGPMGSASVVVYSMPRPGVPKPLVVRWRIDCRGPRAPRRALVELGYKPPRRRSPYSWQPEATLGRLELSCLLPEMGPLAQWLPAWIDARDRGVDHPATSVVMSREVPVVTYAWTSDASILMEAWKRHDNEQREARARARARMPPKLRLIRGGRA